MLPNIQLDNSSPDGNDTVSKTPAGTNDPFLEYLLCNKTAQNLKHLKDRALKGAQESLAKGNVTITSGPTTTATATTNSPLLPLQEYYSKYAELEFATSRTKHESLRRLKAQYQHYQELVKKRRYSVNFDNAQLEDFNGDSLDTYGEPLKVESTTTGNASVPRGSVSTETIANVSNTSTSTSTGTDRAGSKVADYELSELRRRLLGKYRHHQSLGETGHAADENESIDRQIESHDNIQQDLIQDMTKLVNSLKQGAVAFQSALDDDNQVLGAAEIGIQVASRGIADISGKLGRYDRKKLGYLFYIGAALFMFFGLIITFVIIKLFPAL